MCETHYSERMKQLLSYIHENYNKKLTADDIAEHANISRGECFRCFKNFMGKTPVEYINEYRLQKAVKLLRETGKSVTEIGADCGFENASYFIKIFMSVYSVTPLQYRKAQIWTDYTARNINGYDYEYWKEVGNGAMVITVPEKGAFACEWDDVSNIVFRSGKKFGIPYKTHEQIGDITLQYDAVYNSQGCFWLGVYGWTVEPLAEWYIVECFTDHIPITAASRLSTIDIDGGTYEIFRTTMVNKPCVIGVGTFEQYWSIRTSGRSCGNIDVSAHFRHWESVGMEMGKLTEVALSVEGWQSSGNAAIKSNLMSIGR